MKNVPKQATLAPEYVLVTQRPTELDQLYLVGGWALPLLKNDGVKVSWDDDIPNIWKNNPNVPNHQPV